MIVKDLVDRIKRRSHRGNVSITTDEITQQILDGINDARRDIIRLLPKQWLRKTSTFNTLPATVAGGATFGTLTSASSPATAVGGSGDAHMLVSLNGETAQDISIPDTLATGADIALAIQNAVKALVPVETYNNIAYTSFTCEYTGGLYVLTNGSLGTASTVVVTSNIVGSGSDLAVTLKLAVGSGGVAVTGTGAMPYNPQSIPGYDMPSDCQEPVLLRYNYNGADYFLFKILSEREFYLNVFGTTVAPNKPLYFFDAGINPATNCRRIYIWPIADIIYTVFLTYMFDPTMTDLTTADLSSNVPDFPSYVQDSLWKGGLYYFLKNFDDPLGQVAKSDYEQSKQELEIADERDLDGDVQFRMDVGRRITDFRAPGTGIRLR